MIGDDYLMSQLLARFLFKQVVQIAASLIWAKKGDGNLAAGANLTLQAFADFY